MHMGYGLFKEQRAKLAMTPQLRQAITVLQLSAIDLVAYLHQQMNDNPALELVNLDITPQVSVEEPLLTNFDWKEYVQARAQGDHLAPAVRFIQNDTHPIDRIASPSDPTLEQHLLEQLTDVEDLSKTVRDTCKYLISNLDEKGYLDLSIDEVARLRMIKREDAERALRVTQSFEPRGVGSRSLRECLLIQLAADQKEDDLAYRLAKEYLESLAYGKWRQLAKTLKVSMGEIQAAVDRIRALDPRPGARFARFEPRYIIPDLTVEKIAGKWTVIANESIASRVRVSHAYRRMSRQADQETKQYLQDKLQSARWLIHSLEQRGQTILRVMEAITHKQIGFFENGIARLKPMTLKEIAESIGVHESTVSRATQNKYAQTPWGLFRLNQFFSAGLSVESGERLSAESAKAALKEWISKEDRRKPYSDQKLSERFRAEGIEISRRTIAKYREELGIASSAKRKRYDE